MSTPIIVGGVTVRLGGVASESGVARARTGSRSLENCEGRRHFR